jgi:hypothetical protein
VVLLAAGLSLIPAIIVGGLISWLTGFQFVPVVIFIWVLMVIFGRGR